LTPGSYEPPVLVVVGVDVTGAEVARLVLGHGEDPTVMLAVRGWGVRLTQDVRSHMAQEVRSRVAGKHVLTMSFVVEARAGAPLELGVQTRRDQGLVIPEGEVPELCQRVAAYALVTSSRGVLMTQFSDRTNAVGQWGLPGGGLEAGEAPDRAALREAWEESGQVIEVSELALIGSSHWIGRAPTGRLEDFHAVRVVYRAVCPEPTEPVVHDVGGTTLSAAWVQPADLHRLEVTPSWRSLLGVVMAPDEADGTKHHEQDSDADDRARPLP
jgi:8-oxo-dGTP pyrophosphatase MutT (NUDIX family)